MRVLPAPGIQDGDWRASACLATLTFLLYLSLTPWTTLWDRDEPRFAGAAVEMVRSGQYLYPTFNGEVRPQKPVFVYWLMALTVRLLGPSELAVRCWSAFAIGLSALFTYGIGRRLRSPRAGIVAMIVLATSPLVMIEGLAATTDAVLLAATTGAVAAFVRLWTSPPSWRSLAALTLALAIAQLTKGPVGLVVPLAIMLGTWWMAGDAIAHRRQVVRAVAAAAGASVVLFAAWAIPANLATGWLFLTEGLGRETVTRALQPADGHGVPAVLVVPYYVLVIVVGFSPWTAFLPRAAAAVFSAQRSPRPGDGRNAARALLLSWILVPLALFTAAATKLPHYVLPIWPALALAVAVTVDRAEDEDGRRSDSNRPPLPGSPVHDRARARDRRHGRRSGAGRARAARRAGPCGARRRDSPLVVAGANAWPPRGDLVGALRHQRPDRDRRLVAADRGGVEAGASSRGRHPAAYCRVGADRHVRVR